MKKFIIILLALFIMTGCSINNTIEINSDLTINEKINAYEDESYFDSYIFYGYTKSIAVNSIMDYYEEELTENNYTFSYDGSNGTNLISNSYTLESYINKNSIYKNLFDKITYKKEDEFITIETSVSKINDSQIETQEVNSAIINIILPFEVIDSNADTIVENKYTWDIASESNNKKIYIKFNSNKIIYKESQSEVNKNNYISFTIVVAIIFIVILIVGYKTLQLKKINSKI